jgi:hypothetical protein
MWGRDSARREARARKKGLERGIEASGAREYGNTQERFSMSQ